MLRGTIGARPQDLQVCEATEQGSSEWSERHDQEKERFKGGRVCPHNMRKKNPQPAGFLCPYTKQHGHSHAKRHSRLELLDELQGCSVKFKVQINNK